MRVAVSEKSVLHGVGDPSPTHAAWSSAVGRVIRERRAEMGLSVLRFSERSGISRNHIMDYENGRTIPSLPKLSRIALALDWDAGEMWQHIEAIVFGEDQAAE